MVTLLTALVCVQISERPRAVAMVVPPRGTLAVLPGSVQAERNGTVTYLYSGDRLMVKDGPALVLFFADSHRERLKTGQVTISRNGCEPAERVERLKPPEEKAVQTGLQELGPDGRIGAAVFRSD